MKDAGVFDGVVAAVRAVLDGLETVFMDTPWPVVMTVIVVVAWRLAGLRVAVVAVEVAVPVGSVS